MASIKKRTGKNGDTYHVQIRIKGSDGIYATFDDYETALIWSKYKEVLTQEIRNFRARDVDIYTIKDVLIAKFGADSKEVSGCELTFKKVNIWESPISELNHDILMDHTRTLLNTFILRGGSNVEGSGHKKLPAPMTILRKFAYLSSAINFMIKQGAHLENPITNIIVYLRELSKEKMAS